MTELGTVPPQGAPSGPDEQALLQRLRGGEDAAFGELFELHAAAVRRLAQSLAADRSEAEDITAETFFRVLQALRRGNGPRDYIRAYLLTVARRVCWEWHGARRDVPVTDDELTFRAGAGADTHARTAEHTLITTAFTSLPERWRTVLWQTEVEGEQPSMVATHFGLSANATAALARRARQGLRAAYLQAHLSVNRGPDSCRAVVEKLGGFTAGSVTGAEAERIRAHLHGCASCRATQDELRDVCSSLRAHAGVLVLLVPAAASAGAFSGLGATLKSLVMGSKVKVGLALASTAAAGAVGIAAGPVLLSPDNVQNIGLTGGAPELSLQTPGPQQPPPRVQQPQIGIGRFDVRRTEHYQAPSPHLGAADVPEVPGVAGMPGQDPQIPGDQPQNAGEPTRPRDDVPPGTATSRTMSPSKTSSRMDPPTGTDGATASSEPLQPSPALTTTPTSTSTVTTTGSEPTSTATATSDSDKKDTATSSSAPKKTSDPSDSVRPTTYAPRPADYNCPYITP